MSTRLQTLKALATWSLLSVAVAACRSEVVRLSIEFTTIPKADFGGPAVLAPVSGRVRGARPKQRIVLFAKSDAGWWVQPFRSRPFTEIALDSTWTSSIHLGTEYAALLVDEDYRPPATSEALPDLGAGILAVARVAGLGQFLAPAPKTIVSSAHLRTERPDVVGKRRGLLERSEVAPGGMVSTVALIVNHGPARRRTSSQSRQRVRRRLAVTGSGWLRLLHR